LLTDAVRTIFDYQAKSDSLYFFHRKREAPVDIGTLIEVLDPPTLVVNRKTTKTKK